MKKKSDLIRLDRVTVFSKNSGVEKKLSRRFSASLHRECSNCFDSRNLASRWSVEQSLRLKHAFKIFISVIYPVVCSVIYRYLNFQGRSNIFQDTLTVELSTKNPAFVLSRSWETFDHSIRKRSKIRDKYLAGDRQRERERERRRSRKSITVEGTAPHLSFCSARLMKL